MQRIEYSGQMTYADYEVFQMRATRQVFLFSMLVAILVPAVLFTNMLSFYGSKVLDLLNIPVFLFILFLLTKFQMKRTWEKSPFLHAPIRGSISEDGLEWKVGNEVNTLCPWKNIIKKGLYKDIILLYTAPRQAFFIPKRFFNSGSEWDEAVEFLHAL